MQNACIDTKTRKPSNFAWYYSPGAGVPLHPCPLPPPVATPTKQKNIHSDLLDFEQ